MGSRVYSRGEEAAVEEKAVIEEADVEEKAVSGEMSTIEKLIMKKVPTVEWEIKGKLDRSTYDIRPYHYIYQYMQNEYMEELFRTIEYNEVVGKMIDEIGMDIMECRVDFDRPDFDRSTVTEEVMARSVAQYARFIFDKDFLDGDRIGTLGELADGKPYIFLMALEYIPEKNKDFYLLISMYLLYRYGNQHYYLKGKDDNQYAVLDYEEYFGIEPIKLEPEDQELLEELEVYLISKLQSVIHSPYYVLHCSEWVDCFREEDYLSELYQIWIDKGTKFKYQRGVDEVAGIAYLNFQISRALRGLVSFMAHVDDQMVYNSVLEICKGLQVGTVDCYHYGEAYQAVFGLRDEDAYEILLKECERRTNDGSSPAYPPRILNFFAKKYLISPEKYEKAMKGSNGANTSPMLEAIQFVDYNVYDSYRQKSENHADSEKIATLEKYLSLDKLIPDSLQKAAIKYIIGESPISVLYPYIGEYYPSVDYSVSQEMDHIRREFESVFYKNDFRNRLDIYRGIRDCNRRNSSMTLYKLLQEKIDMIPYTKFMTLAFDNEFFYSKDHEMVWFKKQADALKPRFEENPEEVLDALENNSRVGQMVELNLLKSMEKPSVKRSMNLASCKSKTVRTEAAEFIIGHREWKDDVVALLDAKKADARETAVLVLAAWSSEDESIVNILEQKMAKETSGKIIALYEKEMNVVAKQNMLSEGMDIDQIVQDSFKRNSVKKISWVPSNILDRTVPTKDGKEQELTYLQAICLYFTALKEPGIPVFAKELCKNLEANALSDFVNDLFDEWLSLGAEANKKWVLYLAGACGGLEIVDKMKSKITEWANASRSAIATEAAQALALNPNNEALLVVSELASKFKSKVVKTAARKGLELAAKERGMSADELEDAIVPINITDKKQLRAMVKQQTKRLEMVLANGRTWKSTAWKKLFIEREYMQTFALNLVWGVYEDKQLKETFRYVEDGSFVTASQDEFTLEDDMVVSLVHPVELSADALEEWKEHLDDYKIKQPFEQLSREVFVVCEEVRGQKADNRFVGRSMDGVTLARRLQNKFWYKGGTGDGGSYTESFREDIACGYGVEFSFDYLYVVTDECEEVDLKQVKFYSLQVVNQCENGADMISDQNALELGDVPARYYSEIILQLTEMTAGSVL